MSDPDHFHDECAVFGVYNTENAAELVALGLHALQHRGQEASGIATSDGEQFHFHRAHGLVGDIFSKPDVMALLKGRAAIGHNRYPTTSRDTGLANIQPLFANFSRDPFALAHNGHLTNFRSLRKGLPNALFASEVDTEVLLHLAARTSGTVEERLIDALSEASGAWALVVLAHDALYGICDPLGIRPLSIGKFNASEGYVLSSESCAYDLVDAQYVRDLQPGEMVRIDESGVHSSFPWQGTHRSFFDMGSRERAHCVFEFIYFSRPDTHHHGYSVHSVRKEIGRQLAMEQPADVDIVAPVPDSGVVAALGYAEATGITYDNAIIRNHYVGRTFIEPASSIRNFGVKLKHSANASVVNGKRVLLVDDSLVRGTTSAKIVSLMRQAGAREVHMRISSPPTRFSCHYGVDTPEDDQLLARNHSVEEIAKIIDVDSLGFVSREGLYEAFLRAQGGAQEGKGTAKQIAGRYCDACFSGEYPVAVDSKVYTASNDSDAPVHAAPKQDG